MRSNYKKLGDFIQLVDKRNSELKNLPLVGVTINKKFIPSVANTVGSNMKNYKLITKNQFACSLMQVRRDGKIPVALMEDEEAIISQAYPVFEIININELLPQYLMMWMSRSEFDREACFYAVGGVRGSLEWEDFCAMKLPVPSIEKQREIVKEYKTITDRIKLNEQLNKKLEETAQAIYKEWFVDFEFPDENGKPYKSSGGEMVYCDELDMEVPKGWKLKTLGNIVKSASKKHTFNKDELIFFNTSDIYNGEFLHSNYSAVDSLPGQAKKSIQKDDILYSEIRPENKRFALVRVDSEDYVVSTKLMVLRIINNEHNIYRIYHYLTSQFVINELQFSAEGRSGTFPQITYDLDISNRKILYGSEMIEGKWCSFLESYYNQTFARKDENKLLDTMKITLLSKIATIEG